YPRSIRGNSCRARLLIRSLIPQIVSHVDTKIPPGGISCERLWFTVIGTAHSCGPMTSDSPETMNDTAVRRPTRKELEDQARTDLTTEKLAFPPYAGITFKIEYRRS